MDVGHHGFQEIRSIILNLKWQILQKETYSPKKRKGNDKYITFYKFIWVHFVTKIITPLRSA